MGAPLGPSALPVSGALFASLAGSWSQARDLGVLLAWAVPGLAGWPCLRLWWGHPAPPLTLQSPMMPGARWGRHGVLGLCPQAPVRVGAGNTPALSSVRWPGCRPRGSCGVSPSGEGGEADSGSWRSPVGGSARTPLSFSFFVEAAVPSWSGNVALTQTQTREADGQHSCSAGRRPSVGGALTSLRCPDSGCGWGWPRAPYRGRAQIGVAAAPQFPWTEHMGLPGLSPDLRAVSPGPRGRKTSSETLG